jgi:hypothetical protein
VRTRFYSHLHISFRSYDGSFNELFSSRYSSVSSRSHLMHLVEIPHMLRALATNCCSHRCLPTKLAMPRFDSCDSTDPHFSFSQTTVGSDQRSPTTLLVVLRNIKIPCTTMPESWHVTAPLSRHPVFIEEYEHPFLHPSLHLPQTVHEQC